MHTPGPWKLFEGEHSEVVEVLDNRGLPIVSWGGFDDSRRTDEEHNANARLIAQAPAMLVDLESLVALVKRVIPDADMLHEIHNATETISKAKGD